MNNKIVRKLNPYDFDEEEEEDNVQISRKLNPYDFDEEKEEDNVQISRKPQPSQLKKNNVSGKLILNKCSGSI